MRTFIVKTEQSLEDISAELVDGRLGKAQSAAALKRIAQLNPGIGAGRLKPGTVVVVPEGPGLKTGPTKAARDDPSRTLRAEFDGAARETRTAILVGIKQREAERAALDAAFGSDALKRALEADQSLSAKMELAKKSLEREAAADKKVAGTLDNLLSEARGELDKLDRLLG